MSPGGAGRMALVTHSMVDCGHVVVGVGGGVDGPPGLVP
jgi:hypothetical protein